MQCYKDLVLLLILPRPLTKYQHPTHSAFWESRLLAREWRDS